MSLSSMNLERTLKDLQRKLYLISLILNPRLPRKGIKLNAKLGPIEEKESHMPLESALPNTKKITVKISPTTIDGKPTRLDGPLDVVVVSGNGTYELGADGLSFKALTSDDLGDTLYDFGGDGDLGEGKTQIRDTFLLHTIGENAANLGSSLGDIEDK